MKKALSKLKTFALAAVLLGVGGCRDDPAPTPADLIIGTWKVSNSDVSLMVGEKTYVEYLKFQGLSEADAQAANAQIIGSFKQAATSDIEFKKGGAYASKNSTGKWELTTDGKTLTIDKGTAQEVLFKVSEFTSSTLTLTYNITQDLGAQLVFKYHIILMLTK